VIKAEPGVVVGWRSRLRLKELPYIAPQESCLLIDNSQFYAAKVIEL
jgi:hypothetical protein